MSAAITGTVRTASIAELTERLVITAHSDPATAEGLLSQVEAQVALDPIPLHRALLLRAQGNLHQVKGAVSKAVENYRLAVSLFRQAAAPIEAARTESTLVGALGLLGEYEEALQLADAARRVFLEAGLAGRVARLELNVANLCYRLGRLEESLDHCQRAAELLRDSDDVEARAGALINRSVAAMMLHRFDLALAGFAEATAFCQRAGLTSLTGQSEYNRAYLLFLTGRSMEALRAFHAVERTFEAAGDRFHLAQCRLDRSEVLLELNAVEQAQSLAHDAEEIFRELGLSSDRARCLLAQGRCARRDRRYAEAVRCFEVARKLFEREQNPVWAALAALEQASVDLVLGNVERAEAMIGSAAETLRDSSGLFWQLARLLAAEAAISCKDAERARLVLEEWDSQADKPASWSSWKLHRLWGQYHELCGRPGDALDSYKRAAADVEFLRSHILVDDLLFSFAGDKEAFYERIVDLEPDAGEAFRYFDRSKDRALADVMAGNREIPDVPAGLLQLRNSLRADYLALLLKPGSTVSIEHVRRKEQRLREGIREMKIGASHGPSEVDERPMSGDFLGEKEVLLDYRVSRKNVSVFVASRRGVIRVELGKDVEGLRRKIAFLRHHLHRTESRISRLGLDQYLRELYGLLVEPLEELLEERLIVVPHRFLHDLPFHALRSEEEYLAERHIVSYAPSASALRQTYARASRLTGRSIVIAPASAGLEGAKHEVQVAAAWLPESTTVTDDQASSLHEALAEASFIHVASHALFRPDNSMLFIGGDVLTPLDLAAARMSAELVTLSACSTARVAPDEQEHPNFARAFLALRVPSLIASIWDVRDDAAGILMECFYRNLHQSLDAGGSLQMAMAETKRWQDHPFYWAGFILIGRTRLGMYDQAASAGLLGRRI